MKRIINFQKNHELLSAFIVIFVCVLAFNYEAIFGLKTLVNDDLARYHFAMNGRKWFADDFGFFWALILYINKNLMLINIHLARLFHVVIFAIPLSFITFYLNKKYFKVDYIPALFGAIMINILPYQSVIPKHLDGNYPLYSLILFFLSLIFSFEYLKTRKIIYLPLVFLTWIILNYTFQEMGVFLVPSLLIVIFFSDGLLTDRLKVIFVYLSIALYQLYITLFVSTRATAQVTLQTIDVITQRVKSFINWSSLFPAQFEATSFSFGAIHTILTIIVIIVVLVFGLFFHFKNKKNVPKEHRLFIFFYLAVLFFTALPFLLVSSFFGPRYFFTSYSALYFLLAFALYAILKVTFKNKTHFVAVIMALIVIFTGFHRHVNQINYNSWPNSKFDQVCGAIKELGDIKPEAQIVVTGNNVQTGEHYYWSSGYITLCLKRPGVSGIIGNEYSFYDPFLVSYRAYFKKMGGLDIEKPIYSLHYEQGEKKPVVRKYFLRWLEPNNNASEWILYMRDDDTHLLNQHASGVGMNSYSDTLDAMNLSATEILWGGDANQGFDTRPKEDQVAIVLKDFSIWQHFGDLDNALVTINGDSVVLSVDNKLNKYTRLAYNIHDNTDEYIGANISMIIDVEITGMDSGQFLAILQDIDEFERKIEANYSDIIKGDGSYQLGVNRTFSDSELHLVSFFPAHFSEDTNPGAKAKITMIQINISDAIEHPFRN